MPAHIHCALKLPTGETFYINDFVFKDDRMVNQKYISSLGNVGGTGIVDAEQNENGVWVGQRNIILK
jgi:protocatechuate 3,4-dioxygenase beta subunit